MRRDRLTICLSAVLAGFIFAQMSLLPAVIGLAFCVWIVAAALMPAPADEIKENRADH